LAALRCCGASNRSGRSTLNARWRLEPLGHRPHFPQAQHGRPPTNPVERYSALQEDAGELHSQGVAEERHRALQIADCQVAFKKIANWNHGFGTPSLR
jgi:hypothetical protein